jgi:hypothetical protein
MSEISESCESEREFCEPPTKMRKVDHSSEPQESQKLDRNVVKHAKQILKQAKLLLLPSSPNAEQKTVTSTGAPIRQFGSSKNLKHIPCNRCSSRQGATIIWSKVRYCPFEKSCWYAHSQAEFDAAIQNIPCIYMKSDGTCSIPNCRYSHQPVIEKIVKFEKLCRELKSDGTCRFGDRCKFSHDPTKYTVFGPIQQPEKESFYFHIQVSSSDDEEEDEELIQPQDFNEQMMNQLVFQVLSGLSNKDDDSFKGLMNNFEALQAAIVSVNGSNGLNEGEKSMRIQLKNISERQLETIKYIFKSLTTFELEFEVE